MEKIRESLERLYKSFDFGRALQNDPIKFPKKFSYPLDIEISAILSSAFAYGNINCFCNFLEKLFEIMGSNPSDFILEFKPKNLIKKLTIKYRFSSVYDIVAYMFILKMMMKNSPSNSLEYYFNIANFNDQFNRKYPETVSKITNFINIALKIDLTPIYGRDIKTKGLLHFFPHPAKGSPCKRVNLFLRWMVRNRDVDFGIWKTIKPSELIIPLDVHIWRVSKRWGFTERNSQNLKAAIEITEYLRQIEPEDPLKYDFVLCHSDINYLI